MDNAVDTLTDLFGRLPVHMRQWVRHVILLPAPATWAYNQGGNIAIFHTVEGDLELFLHETGHSLDLLGAYPEKPLSSSNYWLTQYDLDSNTCDPYSQTNQVENVAQNTVVGTFNENVPKGYCGVEKKCKNNFHQYATLQTEADLAAPGKILVPGGVCTHRLDNSQSEHQPMIHPSASQQPTSSPPPAQPTPNPPRPTRPTMNSTSLIQPTINSTSPTRPTMNSTSLIQPTMNSTRLSQPTMGSTRLRRRAAGPPDVSLHWSLGVIQPQSFNTKDHCNQTWSQRR